MLSRPRLSWHVVYVQPILQLAGDMLGLISYCTIPMTSKWQENAHFTSTGGSQEQDSSPHMYIGINGHYILIIPEARRQRCKWNQIDLQQWSIAPSDACVEYVTGQIIYFIQKDESAFVQPSADNIGMLLGRSARHTTNFLDFRTKKIPLVTD